MEQKIYKINFANIKSVEDCAKIFEALGLVLDMNYAKENDMEHLIGEEVEIKQQLNNDEISFY